MTTAEYRIMDLRQAIELCPLSRSFDLRPLHAYLDKSAELFGSWLGAPKLTRLAMADHAAKREFMPVLHQHESEWCERMIEALTERGFRSASVLFVLHADCLATQLPENSVAKFIVSYLAGNWVYSLLHDQSDEVRCRFSAGELCANALQPLLLTMVGDRPADWVRHIIHDDDIDRHVWQRMDRDEGKNVVRPLCRQIAAMQIVLDRHGQFSPHETADTTRHPLCPEQLPDHWHKLFRGLLVLALQYEWLTVVEAKAVMARNPKLEPCWLLVFSSEEARGFPGYLPEFFEDLRRRFPALLDTHAHELDMAAFKLDLFFCDFKSWQGRPLSGWLDLCGTAGLLAAARCAQRQPGTLADNWTMRRIAYVTALDPRESSEGVVRQLEQFSVKNLLEILPWAGEAQVWVLQAMQMAALQPLLRWITDSAKPDSNGHRIAGPHLVNDPDAGQDVFDVPGFHAATTGTKPAEVKMLITSFLKAGMMGGLDKIHAALTGAADRAKLWEAAVQKEQQPAMKLLGLLPVDGADDLRERYLALQSLYKRAAQYGPQRQATQQAAAQCGLANLAQSAGYLDSAELEWELEVADGASLDEALQPQRVGEYVVQLVISRFSGAIQVCDDAGRVLRSIPPAIKKERAFVALNQIAMATRDQIRRFTRLMEVRMVRDTAVPVAALRAALGHPAAAAIVTTLVWRDESGQYGLLDKEGLVGPQGTLALSGEHLWVAHPIRLLERHGVAVLAAWQQWLVSSGVVQPFKQLFRELYHPTVAELDLVDTSLRYVGRRIKTRIAQGILQSRGWVPPGADRDGSYRCCYGDRLWAKCALRFGHFLTEESEATIGELWFERNGQRVSLPDVSTSVFSDAMRDIDLVSAVALAGADEEGTQLSTATVAARRVLLRAVAPTLRAGALELKERHALVHGQLADYRIDLASCRIHFEPGGHLCLVPETLLTREEVFLPYAEEDLKTAELLRKALVLMNDGKIKTADFLRQLAVNGR